MLMQEITRLCLLTRVDLKYIPENQVAILEQLSYLTRDELGIDSNGYLKIVSYNDDTSLKPVGTDLISQLINSERTCTIKSGNSNRTDITDENAASQYGVGSDTTVFVDLNELDEIPAKSKNISSPVHISLGHELIHSLRSMKGNRKRDGMNGRNIETGEYYSQEEYDTIGINHIRDDDTYADASNWWFTENALRYEYDKESPMRVQYLPW